MSSWTDWNELVEAGNRFPTPNKNSRPGTISKPTHIVLHITGNNSFTPVHNAFMNASDPRSAHYLIKKDGSIVQYAKDSERAYHAGIKGYVQALYDTGTLEWMKYLRYFPWYEGYGAGAQYLKSDLTPANNAAERAFVARADGSNWPHYSYWSARHGTRIQPINYEVSKDPNNYSIGIEMLHTGSTSAADYEDGIYDGLRKLLPDLCVKYGIPVDRARIVGHEDVNPVERWGWDPNSGFDWDRALDFSAKKYSLPIDLGFTADVDMKTIKKYLDHVEKGRGGGYYPVGANTVWHGGVHIRPEKDSPVLAVLPGKVIAARLPEDSGLANKHYGSCNFILLEHEHKGRKLFSLYMHLKNLPLTPDNETIKTIRWIAKGDLKSNLDSLKSGEVVKFACDVGAGDVLWTSGEYGSVLSRGKLLHWEMFSETNIFEPQAAPPTSLEGETGWASLDPEDQKLRVQGVRADKAEAFEGDKIVFSVTKCSYKDASTEELNKISWRVNSTDGEYSKEFTEKGLKLEFEVPAELKGKELKCNPYRLAPSDSVAVTVKISSMAAVKWLVVEDRDDNYNVDCAQITGLFPAGMWEDENLTMGELVKFYAENPGGNAAKLRFALCKFIGEWGITDLGRAVSALKNRGFWLPDPSDHIKPYLFWQEARAKGVSLPASPRVWHYNPIIALGAIASLDVTSVDSSSMTTRQLKDSLRTLGFLIVGEPDDNFDRRARWAVREFQCYAKMQYVAHVRDDAPASARQGAHLVAQLGQQAGQATSVYVASLESVENTKRYTGPVSGQPNAATIATINHWLENDWRCPVVVEAWNTHNNGRTTLFQHSGKFAENIWHHDEIASTTPRMYVRDFSRYYALPAGRHDDDMHVVGDFVSYLSWSGPRSVPPGHTWPEGEMLPDRLVGSSSLTAPQASTFRVVRAVSEVECLGFFDSANSYDNAFISVGPCHWTLGIVDSGGAVSEGELCGYLSYLKHADHAAFHQAFGFFGVKADEEWTAAGGNGASLFSASSRKYAGWLALQQEDGAYQRLALDEAEGNFFKTWHWYYRFVMAGRTITGYRRRMWDMARMRIRDIRSAPWGAAGPWGAAANNVTVGDVFTSERAMAMILRWHIRFPAHMISGGSAGTRLRNALSHAQTMPAGQALAWNSAPSAWTDQHEQLLIDGLLGQVQAVGNANLTESINYVAGWNSWGSNPRGYALGNPVGPLGVGRNSFQFDASGV